MVRCAEVVARRANLYDEPIDGAEIRSVLPEGAQMLLRWPEPRDGWYWVQYGYLSGYVRACKLSVVGV